MKSEKWEFDNYDGFQHNPSWIKIADDDPDDAVILSVVTNKNPAFDIKCYRDQWGTYITFEVGESACTIAQEDGTRSFVDAMIAALTKLKEITDFDTKPPTYSKVE